MYRALLLTLFALLLASAAWGQQTVSTSEMKAKHAKLYPNHPSGKNILQETQSGKDVALTIHVISEWVDNSETERKLPAYPDHHLVGLVCGADTIVIGSPVADETSLTEKGDFLFTDYRIHVESVTKGTTVNPGSDIVVTRPGGTTRINNHLVNMQMHGFPLFSLNSKYLLFLRYLPETKTYQAFRTGTFLLGNNLTDAVNATDPETAQTIKHTEHQDAFMTEVRAAVTAPCSGISQKLE
jgi:hypothetical protein